MVTLPEDVARATTELVDGATVALGGRLVGAYLVGSFALGRAGEGSDVDVVDVVDVVAVTDGRPDPDALAALAALHARLRDPGGWSAHLEVSWADAGDLRSPMTLGRRWPYVDRGAVTESARHNTAAVRWVLRERAVVLHGPDPRALVAEVPATALRAEALGEARARAEALEDGDGRQAEDDVLEWCRLAHTAEHGTVVTTVEAGRWALDHLDAAHRPVIEAALGQVGRVGRVPVTRALAWDVVRLTGEAALRSR